MRRLSLIFAVLVSVPSWAQPRVLVYLYSSAVSSSDTQVDSLLEGEKIAEQIDGLVGDQVDPGIKVVRVDIKDIDTDVGFNPGKSPENIKNLSDKLAAAVQAKIGKDAIVEGVAFYGHGNKDVYEFNHMPYSGKTFARVVAPMLGKLKTAPNLYVHFASCLTGADMGKGEKNFQTEFTENLIEEIHQDDPAKFQQVDVTAHVSSMNSKAASRTGWLDKLIYRFKLPGMIHRLVMKIPFIPGGLGVIAPAIGGMLIGRMGILGDLSAAAMYAGGGLSVLAKLGMSTEGKILKRLSYRDGKISETRGFFQDEMTAGLKHTCSAALSFGN